MLPRISLLFATSPQLAQALTAITSGKPCKGDVSCVLTNNPQHAAPLKINNNNMYIEFVSAAQTAISGCDAKWTVDGIDLTGSCDEVTEVCSVCSAKLSTAWTCSCV